MALAKKLEIPEGADEALIASINIANGEIEKVNARLLAEQQQKTAEREAKKQKKEAEDEANREKLTKAEGKLAEKSEELGKVTAEIEQTKKDIAALKKALGIKATRAKRKPQEPEVLMPEKLEQANEFLKDAEPVVINTDPTDPSLFTL